jgi:hypothetical protein
MSVLVKGTLLTLFQLLVGAVWVILQHLVESVIRAVFQNQVLVASFGAVAFLLGLVGYFIALRLFALKVCRARAEKGPLGWVGYIFAAMSDLLDGPPYLSTGGSSSEVSGKRPEVPRPQAR